MFCRLLCRQTGRGEGRGHLRHRDHHRPRRLVARGEVVQARALLQAEGIRRSTEIKFLLDNESFHFVWHLPNFPDAEYQEYQVDGEKK